MTKVIGHSSMFDYSVLFYIVKFTSLNHKVMASEQETIAANHIGSS